MKTLPFVLAVLTLAAFGSLKAQLLPEELRGWKEWATWDETKNAGLPSRFDDRNQPLALWPSALQLTADAQGGTFGITLTARKADWFVLPGDANCWPQEVSVAGAPAAVMSRGGAPCVRVEAGESIAVAGAFRWTVMPQSLRVPPQIGVLNLRINGRAVDLPVWDAQGRLWLQRTGTEPAGKDFLSAQVYRLIQDGSPLWLRTRVELSVAGKSREEALGHVLPEGWTLSSVEAPLPCAVDDAGQLKAQVRAGKWVINLNAFRTTPPASIRFAEGAKPLAAEELVGLQNQPGFRLVEISGIPAVDVAQTTYPDDWRQFPVYQWPTGQAFQVEEKMRGMGLIKPPGVTIRRSFWLDEDGKNLTYQDVLTGAGQQTWRLDAAAGHKLGAVKIAGEGQLITRNPGSGAEGVEVRDRDLNLQAVGRLERTPALAATGWQKDAESLDATLNLPPGWRLLAVFGADWSQGDWLTTWTLFDVFMLLIFTMAVWKLWQWKVAAVALLGFLITYHEPGAPQFTWVLLVAVLAAARWITSAAAQDRLRKVLLAAVLLLAYQALPFMIQQVQLALYPQLEPNMARQVQSYGWGDKAAVQTPQDLARPIPSSGIRNRVSAAAESLVSKAARELDYRSEFKPIVLTSNLSQDNKARIQTGPAVPQWTWRAVSFGWRGPVAASERIRLWLIPCSVERLIAVARVALILLLGWLLLRSRATGGAPAPAPSGGSGPAAAAAVIALLCAFAAPSAQAQFPSEALLKQLRERLLADNKDMPQRAEIPFVKLTLEGHRLTMEVEIHATAEVAVPLPGRLPAWSPLTLSAGHAVLRHEDHLWVLAQPGRQTVSVTGLIPPGSEWQWSFLLKPRQVSIDAAGWTVTGLSPNGVPEDQVFFVEQNRSASAEAAYDQKDFFPVVSVERELELGLVWQARTRVKRLSPAGKAFSLSLPLIPGERVMSAGTNVEKGRMEVRFGAADTEVAWNSELTVEPALTLQAEAGATWVERWSLVTSPVWNVQTEGLAPVFEAQQSRLIPVWTPWPGESIQLAVSRPEAVQGATTTVHQARQTTQLGDRQRTTSLTLEVQASIGEDFGITLPTGAEIKTLRVRGQELPVRKEGDAVIVQVRPGDQTLELTWNTTSRLATRSQVDAVVLPVPSANINFTVQMPVSRWLLWADGPVRGPAVRFWGMAIAAALLGALIARVRLSPLKAYEWALLMLGFMQLPLSIGGSVVLWFFALAWRGAHGTENLRGFRFNLVQVILVGASGLSLLAMLGVVHQGLLGRPEMFVAGNGSTTQNLQWFQDRTLDGALPQPVVISVSIWVYRGLMLAWALWLARSVLRWIPWACRQLIAGGGWQKSAPKASVPPPLPGAGAQR